MDAPAPPERPHWHSLTQLARPSAGFVIVIVVALTLAAAWVPAALGSPQSGGPYWLAIPAILAAVRFGYAGAVTAAIGESIIADPLTDRMPGISHPSIAAWPQVTVFLLIVGAVVALLVRRIEHADTHVMRLLDDQRSAAIAAAHERGALSEQLKQRVHEDPLTGLSNREGFLVTMRNRLSLGVELAVLFVDLDDFKTVNDTLGHAVGDELIVSVAGRLGHASRDEDLVARFGGDEFAILLHNLSPQEALRASHRLLAELKTPFSLCGRTVTVRASGGLATSEGIPPEGPDARAAELLRQADLAMYASKAEHTHGVTFYEADMQTEMVERLALESDMHHALAGHDLFLAYQPIIDLRTHAVTAVEALMRWQHPNRGLVPPGMFVPVAEQNGMIVPLTLWAMRDACAQLRNWDEVPATSGLSLALNISGRLVREPGVASAIARELHRSQVDPDRVILEITESLLMEDHSAAVRTLCQLRALGCRLSVDDFGTGYSSLSRLNTLPIDEVKIDQSFVAQLEHGEAGRTIVAASVAMAHGLGLRVVAEGVETERQLQVLRALGCDEGQGYLFGRPKTAEFVADLVRDCNASLAAPLAELPRQTVSADRDRRVVGLFGH